MNLNSDVLNIKGIGAKTLPGFNAAGIFCVNDLIHYFPRAYDVYENTSDIKSSVQGAQNAIYATVKSNPKVLRFNGKSVVSFFVTDNETTAEVKFFNAPFMAKAVRVGDKRVFRGYLKALKDRPTIDQPKMYTLEDYEKLQGKIVPIYPLNKDITNERIKKSVEFCLSEVSLPKDYLSDDECAANSMLTMDKALSEIHFPQSFESQYMARRRIVFDEFVSFVRMQKESCENTKLIKSDYKYFPVADCKRLEESLPFELTGAQKKAINEILSDMESDYLMNRCVQGDVGSGKTIVAIMALLATAANGYQGAMMAPTEVLARQHYENIKALAEKNHLCLKPVLLVGKMPAKAKREAYAAIKSGEVNLIIGTQALIQDAVEFNKLSLVITDEQHRFGVKQREAFMEKGLNPHILVMSATPIPRTLAMIVFAGLSVSIIDELPKNRIPISNCVVNSSFRQKAYEKIKSEIDLGHQAYVICPMVYENEEDVCGLKSVEQHSADLKEWFGEKYRIATLNGKMKTEEKTRVMEEFKEHKTDILVSTTVIEVGIDVPNATVILIENAERFGLSQLHQLRGRVGRGKAASYCILLSDTKNQETLKRLKVLNETNDGFKIAEEDMKLRGPGELNGIRQSGELSFGMADVVNDSDILMLAVNLYDSIKDRIPADFSSLINLRTI